MDATKTIYIEVDEEITEVVDRIREEKAEEIFLVVPQKALLLQSIVNLKILKEETERLDKKVFIVTQDKIGRNLASRAGFVTRRSIDKRHIEKEIEPVLRETAPSFYREEGSYKEETPEETGPEKITVSDIIKSAKEARQREEREGRTVEVNIVRKPLGKVEREKISSPLEKFSSKSFRKKSLIPTFDRKVFLIFFIATVVIASVIIFIILPKATVKILPLTQPLSLSVEVTASSDAQDINLNTYEIPAQVFSWEKEIKETFTATGEEEKGEKARGEVTIYNHGSETITIIAGTRLQAKNGMIFRTQDKVSVSGGSGKKPGTAKVEVMADEGGEEGNIEPQKLTMIALPKETQNQIYARNEKAFSHGTSEKVIKITEDDVKNARENLQNKISEEARVALEEEIKKALPGGDYVFLDQAFKQEVKEIDLDKEIGTEADTFEATAKVLTKAIVYKESDLKNLTMAEVDAVLEENKKIFEPHKEIRTEFKEFDTSEEKMKLTVFLEAVVMERIDEIALKDELAGKRADEAVEFLKGQEGIKDAEVILSPFWVKKVPGIDKKVRIEYQLANG